MIRTVRNALDGLPEQHGTQLDEESLRTLICEAEAIVNSRPIVAVGTNSPEVEPLMPNHLLTMKSRVLMAPTGEFQRVDSLKTDLRFAALKFAGGIERRNVGLTKMLSKVHVSRPPGGRQS